MEPELETPQDAQSAQSPAAARGPRRRNTARLVIGLLILTAGLVFAYGQLTGREMVDLLRYWPVALVVVGLLQLFEAGGWSGRVGAVLWLLAGVTLLLTNLDLLDFDLFDLTPLLIAALGVHLIRRSLYVPGEEGDREAAASRPWVQAFTLMGGVERGHRSRALEGGDLTAVMGGCEVDLSACSMAGDEVVLDTFTLWGGVDIRVPPDWEVVGDVLPILGGFEDKTTPLPGPSKGKVRVRGFAIMGGVEVRN